MKAHFKAKNQNRVRKLRDDNVKYVSMKDRVLNRIRNRKHKYYLLTANEVLRNKKSDTVFILASGSSINNLNDKQWGIIENSDSFGFNYWIVHWHVPTYYFGEYSQYTVRRMAFKRAFASGGRRKKYSAVKCFISSRDKKRGLNPYLTPELLPEEPKIFYFPHPYVLNIRRGDNFVKSDFKRLSRMLGKRSVMYRGVLSIVLALAYQLRYKNIVLLGVDLKDNKYFYDDYEEMAWRRDPEVMGEYFPFDRLHGTMLPKGEKHPISEYIYALNEYGFVPRGVNLYVGTESSLLAERLKVFSW